MDIYIYIYIYIYISDIHALRNTNSFSKPSNQRDLREEPSTKQFAINIHKPDVLLHLEIWVTYAGESVTDV